MCFPTRREAAGAPLRSLCCLFKNAQCCSTGRNEPPLTTTTTSATSNLCRSAFEVAWTQEASHLRVLKHAVHLLPLAVMEGKDTEAGQRANTGVFRCNLDFTAIGLCEDDKCAGSNKAARVVFEVRMKRDLLFGSNLHTATDGVKRSSSFTHPAVSLYFQRALAPFCLLWVITWTDGDDYSSFKRSHWMHFKRHHALLKTLLRDRPIYWQYFISLLNVPWLNSFWVALSPSISKNKSVLSNIPYTRTNE